tara:strand:+ start:34444 stop:34653 length:210 start_codon:yes stop_codon:yes gene_type:complete
MELTKELKDLLNAHEMACVTDFLDEENMEDYLENTDFDVLEINALCKTYSGWGMDSLEDKIINILKENL